MHENEKVSIPPTKDSNSLTQHSPALSAKNINPATIIQRIKMNPESLITTDAKVLQRAIGNQGLLRIMQNINSPGSKLLKETTFRFSIILLPTKNIGVQRSLIPHNYNQTFSICYLQTTANTPLTLTYASFLGL